MATIMKAPSVTPSVVSKFLGINIGETGDTQIKLGESGNMDNFYITDDYKLKKMYGYKSFSQFETPIRGIYGTKIGTVGYLLVATGGKLYSFNQEDLENENVFNNLTPQELGTITDTDCSFFEFGDKTYILSGGYYSWDGKIFKEVEGYIPLVLIGTTPAGVGTEYDEINMLTPKKRQTYSGTGEAKEYNLAQNHIDSVEYVTINGELIDAYTVDLELGQVVFNEAPPNGIDNVEICWSKNDNNRHIIENMRFGTVFGGDVDTRVFLYGNTSYPNFVYFSGNEDGKPSVEYFPAVNQVQVGLNNYAVTDLTRQYDRLLATTNRPDAYYLTIGSEPLEMVLPTGDKVSKLYTSVSVYPLNEAHGNMAFGQGQVLNNYPVTIDKSGITLWKATNVRDERNVQNISERIQKDFNNLDMNLFKTVERQEDNQMWFANGNKIYVYNYANDTFCRLRIEDEVSNFSELGKKLYMSTQDGKIAKWDKDYMTYNENIIKAHWEMNFSDFGGFYLRKTMRRLWVLMQPSVSSSAEIGYITNIKSSPTKEHIFYQVNSGFDNVDFNKFSFQLSINPQPFKLKLKAKKFTNMKLTIDNVENTACTILGIALKVEGFGESK